MNVYFYSRVSTAHQDNSLDAQLAKARAYCTARGFTLTEDHIFTDPDTSGAVPFSQRPGGQLLLNTITLDQRLSSHPNLNPNPNRPTTTPCGDHHLIITKLDRLGRSMLDLETQFQAFKARGVVLHIIDFGGDSMSTAGIAGELILRVLFAVAEFERGMIRARSQDVIDHQRSQNILLGSVPYGWDAQPTDRFNAKKRPIQTLVPNLSEQAWLRQMHIWRTAGWSFHAMAAQLNRADVPTKTRRGRWQSGNVRNVLESRYTRELLAAEATPLAYAA